MELQPVILESQNATSAADGATTERRTRINRPDEGRGRCKGSRASGRRKDFSQCMQQSTTPSTSNVIRTEPFGPQRCRHGTKSSPRREPDVPAELLRALFGNVTKPNRRVSNGEQVDMISGLAMKRGSSVDFSGYWQRHLAR
jgi:hypothetical protein